MFTSNDVRFYTRKPSTGDFRRSLERINFLLRNFEPELAFEAVQLTCDLASHEKFLPCPPFTIEKILLSIAERSDTSFPHDNEYIAGENSRCTELYIC